MLDIECPCAQLQGAESRFHPKPGKPVLIYLPGVHGDWTLFTSFRTKAANDFQLLEFTYPRNTEWSLNDYANFVTQELQRHRIDSGWLLAESYSSQVAWSLVERNSSFQPEGIILAGGFVRYPVPMLASAAARAINHLPYSLWKLIFWIYGQYAKFRHRNAPETKVGAEEFIRRRTPQDLVAIAHRMDLIAGNDPSEIVRKVSCPVYLLAGCVDPVVPTRPVLRWLKKNCVQFSGHRIIWPADHNVLGTEPGKALSQVSAWIAHKP